MNKSDNRLRWFILFLLFIAMVNAYIDRGNISMAAPLISTELLLDPTRLGYIFSAFLLGYALMQIPAGWLVDRYGIKNLYLVFYLLWGITAALFGLANSFWHFIVLRIVLGICEAASGPASFAFIARHFSASERGLASGVFLAGTKIGPAVGAVLAAYLITYFGWRMLFVISGIVPLIWLFPWNSSMKKINKRKEHFKFEKEEESTKVLKIPFSEIIKQRKTWGIFLGYFCYGYVWYLYINWLPSYLYDSVGLSIKDTGWWAGYAYGGLAFVTVTAGYIADIFIRRGHTETKVRKLFVTAGFLCGSAVIVIPFINNMDIVLFILLFAISGMGLATANTWAITQTIAPAGAVGTFTGIQNFGATSGGALAPVLAGYLVDATGSYNTVFALAGIMMLLGIISYMILIGKVETLTFKKAEYV